MTLDTLTTPAAVLDRGKLRRNAQRMLERVPRGVRLRPHFKTAKSIDAHRIAMGDRPAAATVSTLKEAEHLHRLGVSDLTYAVGVSPDKLARAAALVRDGCRLNLITDDTDAAHAIAGRGASEGVEFSVFVEVDTDRHRAGVDPAGDTLLRVARVLHESPGVRLAGVLTHAGESYACHDDAALVAAAEAERVLAVAAADRLLAARLPCDEVSIGSSPTAMHLSTWDRVTEVRAGVYLLWDLFQSNLGLCGPEEIAISVLGTVIGRQPSRGWLILDAGGHALSKDRGTASQSIDYAFGQVADLDGRPIEGWRVTKANQEHGIVESSAAPIEFDRYPVGVRVRVLPNHACATGACHDRYAVVDGGREVVAEWPRINGW